MNQKLTLLVLFGLIGFSVSTYAAAPTANADSSAPPKHARHGLHDQGRFSHERWANFEKTLDLSADQKTKLDEINLRFGSQVNAIEDKMKPIHESIRKELDSDQVDYDAIRSDFNKLAPYETDIKILGLKHFAEIQGILTPEQQKKMKEHRKKMLQQPFFRKMQTH